MTEYVIYFNQQWVGDHTEEWFQSRVAPSMAVVEEMQEAGVFVYGGGLDEDGPVFAADATSGEVLITDGPFVETKELLGGFAVIDVADEEAAKYWAGRLAEGCGWPQEVRRASPDPMSSVSEDCLRQCSAAEAGSVLSTRIARDVVVSTPR